MRSRVPVWSVVLVFGLLVAVTAANAVGYQPNFIRNLMGPITVTGDLTVTDDLAVTDDLSADVASVASIEFTGGGTPGLERGGATAVQTRSGDGFFGLGASGFQSTIYFWDGISNTATGAPCSGRTGSVCFADDVAGSSAGTTTWTIDAATGLLSGDTGISSGPFGVMWVGGAAVPEGSNGQGSWKPTTVGRGSKVGQVCCSCRVAGSGGTEGIFVSLMETGVEVASVEVSGGDSNACDDAAGTSLCGNLATAIVAAATYTGQFKATTDCAGNPTDCLCNFDVTR
jgi:hypothetical protein